MMRSVAPILVAALLAPVAGSAQEAVVVQSSAAGAWGADLRLVEELRIGVLEGSESYTFGNAFDVVVGRDGTIVVAERQPVLARMDDADGTFGRRIGGGGEGPGGVRRVIDLRAQSSR